MMILKLFEEIEIDRRTAIIKPDMVIHTRNSRTWESKVGESQVQSPQACPQASSNIPRDMESLDNPPTTLPASG